VGIRVHLWLIQMDIITVQACRRIAGRIFAA
jgi:hypothetical protein